MIKFELLADLDDQPAGATVVFDGCNDLGAANLRGTGFAVHDVEVRQLRVRVGATSWWPTSTSRASALDDLRDNFADVAAQGAVAYADEMSANYPNLDRRTLLADGVTAVGTFHAVLVG